ncbi:MAG: DUF1007 family protein [Methylobacteriaceae bacterium]|nr:DUF1007 family protein [Methylobacteriaceae bacterium]
MTRRSARLTLLMAAWLAWAAPALAHPHVWIVARAAVIYAPDGRVAAIGHEWTFDKAYSAYAVQGLAPKEGAPVPPEKLAELARTNVESLAEFGYFTHAKANGAKLGFGAPRDYEVTQADGALTLRFLLPLDTPAKANRAFALDLYDPSYFVDFQLAGEPDPVRLVNAPAGCALNLARPKPMDEAEKALSEGSWSGLANAGLRFSNRVIVACP